LFVLAAQICAQADGMLHWVVSKEDPLTAAGMPFPPDTFCNPWQMANSQPIPATGLTVQSLEANHVTFWYEKGFGALSKSPAQTLLT